MTPLIQEVARGLRVLRAEQAQAPAPALLPRVCGGCATGQETRQQVEAILAQLVARTLEGERSKTAPIIVALHGACLAALRHCQEEFGDQDRRLIRRLERALALADGRP